MPSQTSLNDYCKLYLVLETSQLRLPIGDFVIQAIEGGVTAIQLRDKTSISRARFETAKMLKSLLTNKDVLFIINNNPDIAEIVGAHGVHLGMEDLPPKAVRTTFPELVVGYSCNNIEDCNELLSGDAHYAGIGPAFFTATKSNLRQVIGVEGIHQIFSTLPVPAVAIGGINEENVHKFTGSKNVNGANIGIAVSSVLCQSQTPYDVALNLRKIIG